MKYIIPLFTLIFLFCMNLQAKDDAKGNDTTKAIGWHPRAMIGLDLSQISLKNWSQGGDNSMTWSSRFNGGLEYYSPDGWEFRNSLRLSYGRTKFNGQDYRTNDNELYLESVLSRRQGWAVDPFFSNNVRTSLTTGYLYPQNVPVAISNFFDPAYVTQSLGFTYDKNSIVRTRLGVAVQETFVNKNRQYTNDTSITRDKAFKLDTGMESVTNIEFHVAENVKMFSNLRLFTRFESLSVWDIRWENVITGKINSFLSMNFSYLVIYQKDQSPYTQMKEGLNVGFVYTIL